MREACVAEVIRRRGVVLLVKSQAPIRKRKYPDEDSDGS